MCVWVVLQIAANMDQTLLVYLRCCALHWVAIHVAHVPPPPPASARLDVRFDCCFQRHCQPVRERARERASEREKARDIERERESSYEDSY